MLAPEAAPGRLKGGLIEGWKVTPDRLGGWRGSVGRPLRPVRFYRRRRRLVLDDKFSSSKRAPKGEHKTRRRGEQSIWPARGEREAPIKLFANLSSSADGAAS